MDDAAEAADRRIEGTGEQHAAEDDQKGVSDVPEQDQENGGAEGDGAHLDRPASKLIPRIHPYGSLSLWHPALVNVAAVTTNEAQEGSRSVRHSGNDGKRPNLQTLAASRA